MKEYLTEMPWIANKFGTKKELKEKYGVEGIPCLVVLKDDGTTLATKEGRADMSSMGPAALAKWIKLAKGE